MSISLCINFTPTFIYPGISLTLITLKQKLMLRLLGLLVSAFQESLSCCPYFIFLHGMVCNQFLNTLFVRMQPVHCIQEAGWSVRRNHTDWWKKMSFQNQTKQVEDGNLWKIRSSLHTLHHGKYTFEILYKMHGKSWVPTIAITYPVN